MSSFSKPTQFSEEDDKRHERAWGSACASSPSWFDGTLYNAAICDCTGVGIPVGFYTEGWGRVVGNERMVSMYHGRWARTPAQKDFQKRCNDRYKVLWVTRRLSK